MVPFEPIPFVDEKEQGQRFVRIDWLSAKGWASRFLKRRVRLEGSLVDGEIVFDLGHNGRRFDDFPRSFEVPVDPELGIVPVRGFFIKLADEIESYVAQKMAGWNMPKQVSQCFEEALDL
ncbi:MAG: hypothetical protein GXP43_00490, partial [bacterium]|nr:hypothetical protein [bacterium]